MALVTRKTQEGACTCPPNRVGRHHWTCDAQFIHNPETARTLPGELLKRLRQALGIDSDRDGAAEGPA